MPQTPASTKLPLKNVWGLTIGSNENLLGWSLGYSLCKKVFVFCLILSLQTILIEIIIFDMFCRVNFFFVATRFDENIYTNSNDIWHSI